MKKHLHVLALLLVAVMLVSALAGCGGSGSSTPASGSGSTSAGEPADANPNAGRETVNIRFAQFGNSVDDVDGMENDPIKKAIEEAVNVTLEYDTGTDGFDERMQTELFTAAPPTCSPPGARARRSANGLKRTSLSISPRSSMLSPTDTPRCTKSSTATSTRLTTSCTQAMKTPPMPFIPWPRLRTPALPVCPCTILRF